MGIEKIRSELPELKKLDPERKLWCSVYTQAIREACKEDQKIANAAYKWLSELGRDEKIGSAAWICNITGIDFHSLVLRIIKFGTREEKEKLRKDLT